MSDPRDIVDIQGLRPSVPAPARGALGSAQGVADAAGMGRPWLGVMFRCCAVYARIYRSHDSDRYVGTCPRCGAEVRARVGNGGTSQRIFYAQ